MAVPVAVLLVRDGGRPASAGRQRLPLLLPDLHMRRHRQGSPLRRLLVLIIVVVVVVVVLARSAVARTFVVLPGVVSSGVCQPQGRQKEAARIAGAGATTGGARGGAAAGAIIVGCAVKPTSADAAATAAAAASVAAAVAAAAAAAGPGISLRRRHRCARGLWGRGGRNSGTARLPAELFLQQFRQF